MKRFMAKIAMVLPVVLAAPGGIWAQPKKSHPTGKLVSPAPGDLLGTKVELEAVVTSPYGRIRQVDFLSEYEDVNLEGDGVYRQWHYQY